MDETLEELYALLDLYFSIQIGCGFVKAAGQVRSIEPALDHIEWKEDILKKILETSQKLPAL